MFSKRTFLIEKCILQIYMHTICKGMISYSFLPKVINNILRKMF